MKSLVSNQTFLSVDDGFPEPSSVKALSLWEVVSHTLQQTRQTPPSLETQGISLSQMSSHKAGPHPAFLRQKIAAERREIKSSVNLRCFLQGKRCEEG